MKRLKKTVVKSILWICLTGMSVNIYALDQSIQEDLLMAKITASIKADKSTDALPYFAELEGMESSLSKPLPERFHYYYIEALSKSGNNDKALSRADIYWSKFGKKGKYYDKVIEIISPIQIQKDKDAAGTAAKKEEDTKEYNAKLAEYNKKIEECPNDYMRSLERAKSRLTSAENACVGSKGNYLGYCDYIQRMIDRNGEGWGYQKDSKYRELNAARKNYNEYINTTSDEYCSSRYTKPKMPESLR